MLIDWTEQMTELCKNMVTKWVHLKPIENNQRGLLEMHKIIINEFESKGFLIEKIENPYAPYRPIIIAKLFNQKNKTTIGFFGHYDVEPADSSKWNSDPWELTELKGRWQARGLTDNFVPLAQRLIISDKMAQEANLIFVLQGEEEIGSPFSLEKYSSIKLPKVDLWIEETGYFYKDGRHRMMVLNRTKKLERVINEITKLNLHDGRKTNIRNRPLNKAFGAEKCPCLVHLLKNTPYIAIGPNDDFSKVHGINESIDPKLLKISANQLMTAIKVFANG